MAAIPLQLKMATDSLQWTKTMTDGPREAARGDTRAVGGMVNVTRAA